MTIIDTSDPKAVGKAIKAAKSKDEVREEGLRQLLGSAQGRAWMWHHIEECRPFRNPFSIDPGQMAFNCGEANIGLQLIGEIHRVAPELYLVMMKENQNG